jgi:hypothetical protein
MAEPQIAVKAPKVAKSLVDEITATKEKLRRLEERHRETMRKEKERNVKAVYELLRDEKLDVVASADWHRVLPQLKKLLLSKDASAKTPEAGAGSTPA